MASQNSFARGFIGTAQRLSCGSWQSVSSRCHQPSCSQQPAAHVRQATQLLDIPVCRSAENAQNLAAHLHDPLLFNDVVALLVALALFISTHLQHALVVRGPAHEQADSGGAYVLFVCCLRGSRLAQGVAPCRLGEAAMAQLRAAGGSHISSLAPCCSRCSRCRPLCAAL